MCESICAKRLDVVSPLEDPFRIDIFFSEFWVFNALWFRRKYMAVADSLYDPKFCDALVQQLL